jgi:MFS transporter, putative metabolite:H+ symporter
MTDRKNIGLLSVPVIVAALGYFVDIYDLLLFSIIRVKSLRGIGLDEHGIELDGKHIIAIQMGGLLLGGFIWGIIGDKKGRLSVLFGSILLYSVANIANGFVHTVWQYELARFIAGIGLAGELGAGVTLVSELVSKEKRGIATSIVAGVGLTGAIAAYAVAHSFEWMHQFGGASLSRWAINVVNNGNDWRYCYFLGGILGFLLLIMRVSVFESGMYSTMQMDASRKGNLGMFLEKGYRLKKYILAILIGLPCWYVIGILFTFSKEFGEHFGIKEPIDSGRAVMYAYIFISIGDLLIGFISNYWKSRKKALMFYYVLCVIGIIAYFTQKNGSATFMYIVCMFLGFATGFWALFVTMAAEHFGTNLRATVTTTVPNMVRGSLILMLGMFEMLAKFCDYINAAIITGAVVMAVSIVAVILTEETFGKDLNYVEE